MSTLTLNPIPAHALDLVRAALKAMPKERFGALDLASADISKITIFAYLPVTAPVFDSASKSVRIGTAADRGRVALLQYQSTFVAAVFIDDSTGSAPASVLQMSFGGLVDDIVAALKMAEKLTQRGSYLPGLMLVSPLGLNVLHMVAASGNAVGQDDFFVPLGAPSTILPDRQYDAPTLQGALTKGLKAFNASMAGSPTGVGAYSN
jgi:hypothetical protein